MFILKNLVNLVRNYLGHSGSM